MVQDRGDVVWWVIALSVPLLFMVVVSQLSRLLFQL